MNVLFIITSLAGGGAERVVSRVSSALAERHKVYIIVTHPKKIEPYAVDPRVTVKNLTYRGILGRQTAVTNIFQRLRAIRRLKKEWKIDCSISFLPSCNIDNIKTSVGERKITSIRCIYAPLLKRKERSTPIIRMSIKSGHRSDRIVCVSKRIALEQRDDFGIPEEKLTYIYNPCDYAAISESAAKTPDDPKFSELIERYPRLFITAGRMAPQKAQWHLIRAFAKVAEDHPDASLVILGQGKMEGYLREVIKANGLEERVYLPGFRIKPWEYIGRSTAFVLPSMYEGFSNSLLEAMACDVPLIACDCDSGPRELLAPGTDVMAKTHELKKAEYGILLPVCSGDTTLTDEPLEKEEAELAKAMDMIIEDPKLAAAYVERGKERILDFATERIVEQWEKEILKK